MKIDVNENGDTLLREVYNSIVLRTNADEELAICMRDSGLEFRYQDTWYSAKEGKVEKINTI